MTVIATERLELRRFTPGDAEFILALLNDGSFLRFIGDRGVRTVDAARAYIEKGPLDSYERNGFGPWLVVLKETGASIGLCGLLKRDWLADVDVGFALLPAYRSKGYATESVRAVLDHGRQVIGLSRIVAVTSPDNAASMKLLGKLGFGFERLVRAGDDGAELRLFALESPTSQPPG